MGALVFLMITFLPGLLVLALGIAPQLAGGMLVEATWARILFVVVGGVVTLLSLRAIARLLLGKKEDAEARFKRAPYVATALVGSGVLLLAFAGSGQLSGAGSGTFRLLLGLYGAWLVLFGAPAFFSRKLQKLQPLPQPDAPFSCSRCGVTLGPGTRVCTYCGNQVA